ncbi:MAG: hypothetical protein HDQ98_00065, partial [Lachnospiraceae bacterium]|nr:hypothetical protein [Lachnospiraceae bacterium]
MRKKISLLLVCVIFCVSVWGSFSQTLYAKQPSEVLKDKLENLIENAPNEIAKGILISLGIVIDDASLISDSAVIEAYKSYLQNAYSQGLISITDSGFLVSQTVVDHTREVFSDFEQDLVWLPVITEKNLKASWFTTLEDYGRSSALLKSHDLVFFRAPNVQFTIGDSYLKNGVYADVSNIVMCGGLDDTLINAINYITPNFGSDTSTGTIFKCAFAEENGVAVNWYDLGWQYYDTDNGSWASASSTGANGFYVLVNPFFKGNLPWKNQDIYILCASSSSGIHYVPYFRSLAAYKDYVTGNGNYYKFDSGYTGGDITINPDADYSQITDAIKDAMLAAIASGKSVTNALSDMQKAFTSALDKLNESLGDISDNTAETNTWLQKIYELLEQQQDELLEYFDKSGQSLDDLIGLLSHTGSDGSRTSIYDLFGSFLLLFRVQQEDLQQFMEDAQDFFKMQPVKLGIMIEAAKQDIVDA